MMTQCKNFSHPYLVSDLRVDFLVYHTREMANFKQIQRFVSKIKCPDPGKLVKLCSYLSSCHFLAVLFTNFTKIWITKISKLFFWHFFCFYLLPEKLLQLYQNFCKVYQINKKNEKFSFKVCWFQLFLVTILASVFFLLWGYFCQNV